MRLESLYRVRFIYPEGWAINITGVQGSEGQHLYFRECTPWEYASIVIDNDDLAAPFIVSRSTGPEEGSR